MTNKELPFIKDMFDSIAHRYDFLNRSLSLFQDVYWRKQAVRALKLKGTKSDVLDAACGTCDVALEVIKQTKGTARVVGADFSFNMLKLGQKKIEKEALEKNLFLMSGNALALSFKDQTFDAVTIAFGIRNIADKKTALSEFYRVLKPGGRVAVLELTTPENKLFNRIYFLYFNKILPAFGGLFSKNLKAYQYLPESVLNFPASGDFAETIKASGFSDVSWKKMTVGIVTLFAGEKKS